MANFGLTSKLMLVLSSLVSLFAHTASCGELDFNRDIRPILSDKCFHCHGPDADNQDSEFRLDSLEKATQDLGGYFGIVAHQPERSELVSRVESNDPDLIMPPPDAPRGLTTDERQMLRQWVEEGAEYDQHWSFQKPIKVKVPDGKNAIDYFVQKRLPGAELTPSPRANKRQLIRRVTLDLTGLPPTPEEVQAFLEDTSEDAYPQLVNRLLASTAYGERMAAVWLDAARYADTAGYQNDFRRTQWPWRDWVIKAYNSNMPFDQFSIEQLAGDLLPNATDETRLATAFNRNHRINNEGGIIPDEFLVEYVADRVETTSTVWLGLTTGCARCHDHKYDPIKMTDFYRMFAFFHNVPEKGKDGAAAPTPNMDVYTSGSAEQHAKLQIVVADLKKDESEYAKDHQGDFKNWLTEHRNALDGVDSDSLPEALAHFAFDYPRGKSYENLAQPKSLATIQGRAGFVSSIKQGKFGSGLNFKSAGHVRLGKTLRSAGFASDQEMSWSFFVKPQKDSIGTVISCQSKDERKVGYQISLEPSQKDKQQLAITFQLVASEATGQSLKVRTQATIESGGKEFTHVGVTYDGSETASGVAVYLDGQLQELVTQDDAFGEQSIQLQQDHLLGSGLSFAAVDELYVFSNVLSASGINRLATESSQQVLLSVEELNNSQTAYLEQEFFEKHDANYAQLIRQLSEAEKRLATFEKKNITKVSIMEEMAQPRETFLLLRGDYTQPDKSQTLEPQTIASLPGMAENMPKNRLGLAMWLFQHDNPLTARVAVNRYWQMLFGQGLVTTPEDFGSQGAMPSHPQLLDWLAVEFRESGWNVKAMLKRIVTSETYCQDSRVDAAVLEKDPKNVWLSRGARFRLSAFAIRDQALASSGLLSRKMGGPPVMPYQPAGLWDELSAKGFKYIEAKDEGLYRRSLYTFWRRTVPPPSMMNFDSAGREACTVSASRTNTPLQAINLMNDPQFVEAARALGERSMKEATDDSPAARIVRCSELIIGRPPNSGELEVFVEAYKDYLAAFSKNPSQANELIGVGVSKPDAELDSVQLATCTAVASVFLNLDEAVTKE